MQQFVRNNLFLPALMILSMSVLIVWLILFASAKIIAAFALLPVLAIFFLRASDFVKIILPIILITFPVTLQVFGRDAFSTGTLVIFITLAWSLTKAKISTTINRDRIFFLFLFMLAVIAAIGMFTKTASGYQGTEFRHYINFISSLGLFTLVVHAQHIPGIAGNQKEYIERLINVLLLITVIHVFLSLLIFNFPFVENYFSIFLKRGQEHLGGHIQNDIYTRATSVFTGGEEFGELLILLFPFALYKIIISRQKIYWFIVASLLLGVLISGTRSAFFLIIFQTWVLIYILLPRKYNTRKLIITLSFGFLFLMLMPVLIKYAPILMDRVQVTLDQIGQDDNLLTIANRGGVWPLAWDVTTKTISLFGHGPIQAYKLGFPSRNFHNLYLSMVFQFGVVGSIIFLMVFYRFIKKLSFVFKKKYKNDHRYLLSTTCLLSLFCFLINEIKFEFNRSDSYQQFVWIFFALFYLTGRLWKNEKSHCH